MERVGGCELLLRKQWSFCKGTVMGEHQPLTAHILRCFRQTTSCKWVYIFVDQSFVTCAATAASAWLVPGASTMSMTKLYFSILLHCLQHTIYITVFKCNNFFSLLCHFHTTCVSASTIALQYEYDYKICLFMYFLYGILPLSILKLFI
jgi:hypothetical protein